MTDTHGLITVTGGKWTTYRAMANEVMDACFEAGMLPRRAGGASLGHALVGASASAAKVPLEAAPGWHLYGSEEPLVRACPGADRILGMGLTEAMVRFAARHEYAWTVEDVLARRWRALFLDVRQALAMAPTVAQILLEETGLDPRQAEFEALCRQYG